MKKKNLDYAVLKELYIMRKVSLPGLGKILKCSPTTVYNYLIKYKLSLRGRGELHRGKKHPLWGKKNKWGKHTQKAKRKITLFRLGKTWDEQYGSEKANSMRQALRTSKLGDKNPNWHKSPSKQELRNMRKRVLGNKNPFWHKKHTKKSRDLMKIKRAEQILPFRDTSIEVKLQEGLTSLDIPFKKHVPILGHPDLFISPGICIFADGDYWHGPQRPKQQLRDKSVTRELKRRGYAVLRFKEHNINTDLNTCLSKIRQQYTSL